MEQENSLTHAPDTEETNTVWESYEEARKHAKGNVVGPYKTNNGCTLTLYFAEKSKPGVRESIAEALLNSFLRREKEKFNSEHKGE